MAGHRHTKGILSRLGKADVKTKPKRRSAFQKAIRWIGFSVAMAFLLLLVAGSLSRLFVPSLSVRQEEAVVKVIEVQDHAEGFPAAAKFVAAAVVEIDGRAVRVGLTEESKAGVEVGKTLRVKYSYSPGSGGMRVDDWAFEPAP